MKTNRMHYRNKPQRRTSEMMTILGVLCILYSYQTVYAQEKNLVFEKVETPNIHVDFHSAAEDNDGFIWFGAFDGLYRYNGLNFTVFTNNPGDSTSLTFGRPLYVVKGRENDLWIGTNNGGVSRLDLSTYRFESFQHEIDKSNSIGGNNIGDILVDNDSIVWVGSNEFCLSRLDRRNNEVQRFYPETTNDELEYRKYTSYLGSIVADPSDPNLLWIGAPYGVYCFSKETFQFKLFRISIKPSVYRPVPRTLCVDQEGIVWAGSEDGLMRIDPHSGELKNIAIAGKSFQPEVIGSWRPTVIQNFSDDEIVILTHFDGLFIYNKITGVISRVNNDASLGRGSSAYLKDRLGNIWIESNSSMWRHTPKASQIKQLSLLHLTGSNWSRSVLPVMHKNELYIGTFMGAGLLHVDFDQWQVTNYNYDCQKATTGDVFMRDLSWHKGTSIYIASDGGLLQFNTDLKQISHIDDNSGVYKWKNITAVCSCNDDIWFASEDEGLFAIEPERNIHILSDHIPSDLKIKDIVCFGNTLWIGTDSRVTKLDLDKLTGMQTIVSDINVSQMTIWDSTLWVSTYGQGLFTIDSRDHSNQQNYVNLLDGGTNLIYSFTRAKNGIFWLNTDGGTVSFNPTFREYVKYVEMGVGRRSPIIQLPNGIIVSGGYKKISFFDPDKITDNGILPALYITKIDIANRQESFDFSPDRVANITLQPNERELTVEFDAINFNTISTTDFEYRMNGLTEGWQKIGSQRYLNINNPPHGSHTLELKAVNAYGGESKTVKNITINVLPPIYRQLWFQLLALIAIVIAGIFAYLQRQKRKKKRLVNEQRERELLAYQKEIAELKLTALQAQMNPHFIFNSLNSINWYILKNKPAEASIYLTKFSKLVRRILDNSKSLSIPLDSEISALRLYLDLEAMRFDDKFSYEIQMDDEIDFEEVLIPPLILQPFVENSIWHGLMHKEGQGSLLIQIYPENGYLKCIVQDDGIGRRASQHMKSKTATTHQSKGYKLTTDRIKLAHKNFHKENSIRVIDMVSADGTAAGTRVEVLLPYE